MTESKESKELQLYSNKLETEKLKEVNSKFSCSKSLYESIHHLNKKYNFSIAVNSFEDNDNVKKTILSLYVEAYKKFINQSIKVCNKSILHDLLIFKSLDSSSFISKKC